MSIDAVERAAQLIIDAQERERVRQVRRREQLTRRYLRIHVATFVAVQLLLFGTWLVVAATTGFFLPWFVFPLAGWSIGLVAHVAAARPLPEDSAGA